MSARRFTVFLVCLFTMFLITWSFQTAQATGYGVELVGVDNQYTLPPGSSETVTIRITGPGMGAINSAVLKLNGKRVAFENRVREAANSMIGTMSGLQPGDNLIQLYANVRATDPVVQLRTSILLTPTTACTSMKGMTFEATEIGLPTGGAEITDATLSLATADKNVASTTPEYCNLTGVIYPATSSGLNINFRVAIPTEWNQKSWQFGGGGTDGSIPNLISPSTSAMLPSNVPRPLALQYAT